MGNMMDYIKWRGDLSFAHSPFNLVDNLLLAYFAYVNLDGIARLKSGEGMTLKEASDAFFEIHSEEELQADRSFIRLAPYLMREMAESVRFGGSIVRNYINQIVTDEEMQFSAVELVLDDGSTYISYRGTDATIVGWKEDFNISNGVVPAQEEALSYLNRVGRTNTGVLRVGGHSKGGNLAVYAALNCDAEVQERVRAVYDNDGPGFAEGFLGEGADGEIHSRIVRIVPEFSVIGMLLHHPADPLIVKSSQKGLLQHDAFSWGIIGPDFDYAEDFDPRATEFNGILARWISDMDDEKRRRFVDDLFSVFQVTGGETFSDVGEGGLRNVGLMIRQIEKVSPDSRAIIEELAASLFADWKHLLFSQKKAADT